jgi:hypothetical protein
VCRECRAERERERHKRQVEAHRAELDEEERERHEAWKQRRLTQWRRVNEERRRRGEPELPEPYLEPDWLERLREQARVIMAPRPCR